jgi:hypothetical protein
MVRRLASARVDSVWVVPKETGVYFITEERITKIIQPDFAERPDREHRLLANRNNNPVVLWCQRRGTNDAIATIEFVCVEPFRGSFILSICAISVSAQKVDQVTFIREGSPPSNIQYMFVK